MGLATVFGSGASTNSYDEFEETDLILLVGSNAAEAHPIIFQHMMRGVRKGTQLIVVDPRATSSSRWADLHLPIAVGSDIALLNAMAHVIIRDGLANRDFIERATQGFSEFRDQVAGWTPDRAADITGLKPELIEEVARRYARAPRAMTCWTLGITEHHNAVDNVFALINLALLTGHVGRRGSGLNPLRGQNNVQGGGDMGALPNRLPGFQDLRDPNVRRRFEEAWHVALDPESGWSQTEMFQAMEDGRMTGLYVIGENPVVSEANAEHVRHLFENLDALVVQDIFLTDTAEMADVVFPARAAFAESDGTFTSSERRVQRVRKARTGPGQSQDDLWILTQLARVMGHDWPMLEAEALFDEMRQLAPLYRGITYDRLDREPGVQWPCPHEGHPGTQTLHGRLWDKVVDPKVPFIPVEWEPPSEPPHPDYPLLLTTGRRLAFYNTGAQSNLYDHPHKTGEWLDIHPDDARSLGISDGETVRVQSKRGAVEVPARYSRRMPVGTVFMAFHFPDKVLTNRLSVDATDPQSGTAEFKAARIRIEKI